MTVAHTNKVHFIGIGGIGMSGLARLFLHEKKTVSGSDRAPSDITHALESEGVHFFSEQVAENITDDVNLVVYTEAMPKDHPELEAARAKNIPLMSYFEALGLVANQYYLIAVAGTHGKTTTTAMTIDVLEAAGLDPTAIVGSLRSKTQSNFRAGKTKYMVVEACEYRRDFLSLTPDILIITNIEAEHLDYYKDLADVQDGFRTLASQVREGGYVVCKSHDSNIAPVIDGIKATVVDYGKYIDPLLSLKQPGMHNYENAAAATAASEQVGVEKQTAKDALEAFAGTWRRFECKGEMQSGALVYDDYAHHPTEIRAAIQGARELYPKKNIIIVFQPHLYSRTAELFEGFVESLSGADRLIIATVYDARDTYDTLVTSKDLAAALQKQKDGTEYIDSFDGIVEKLKTTTTKDDVVFIMGAGDLFEKTSELLKK